MSWTPSSRSASPPATCWGARRSTWPSSTVRRQPCWHPQRAMQLAMQLNHGATMHPPASAGHVGCVEALLEAGASPTARCNGSPPLTLAVCAAMHRGREPAAVSMVQALLRHGASALDTCVAHWALRRWGHSVAAPRAGVWVQARQRAAARVRREHMRAVAQGRRRAHGAALGRRAGPAPGGAAPAGGGARGAAAAAGKVQGGRSVCGGRLALAQGTGRRELSGPQDR